MSLNLSELQQKANQVLFNSDEAIRRWVEFISAPAGTVSLEYYDKNGNLQQVSFDNRNKLVQNFISNVNSAMTKTFYVDSINGNDNNDGSQNAPFKTIAKAINSVPVGGKGVIHLIAGQTYTIDSNIFMYNKNIEIIGDLSDKPTIQGIAYSDDNFNYIYNFQLSNSFISIRKVKITLPNKANSSLNWYLGAFGCLFTGKHPAGGIFLCMESCDITLPSDAPSLYISGNWNRSVVPHLIFENTNIIRDGGYICIVQDGLGVFSLTSVFVAIKDSANNSLTWNDVLSGIVKDSNGVPRNVISNVIL